MCNVVLNKQIHFNSKRIVQGYTYRYIAAQLNNTTLNFKKCTVDTTYEYSPLLSQRNNQGDGSLEAKHYLVQ